MKRQIWRRGNKGGQRRTSQGELASKLASRLAVGWQAAYALLGLRVGTAGKELQAEAQIKALAHGYWGIEIVHILRWMDYIIATMWASDYQAQSQRRASVCAESARG